MRLANLTAVAHRSGHRIDLSWENPEAAAFPGARVVRREGTHPTSPEPAAGEGRVVADTASVQMPVEVTAEGIYRFEDRSGLAAESVYYYAVYPYSGNPPAYDVDLHNRTVAMATGRYGFAEHMYGLLPAIYHRYDSERGQLRRFLDLPGGELDRLHSCARALADLYHLDRVDGRLLPFLAQWIGWKTDFRLELDGQRNEIRNAPALYHTVGLIPTVAATVKRTSGWESRAKEFVHNVFATNRPERLNLWLAHRDALGEWTLAEDPLSLDYAYEGRPAAARDGDGTLHLFFHTPRRGGWAIWTKTRPAGGEWTASQPVVDRGGVDKHPAAALQGATLWLFWGNYDADSRSWRIDFRIRSGGEWSAIDSAEPFGDGPAERRSPSAAVDPDGGLWLFWLERAGRRWRLRYNRHDGVAWQGAADFPPDGTDDPGVEDDVHVVAHPADPVQRLWVFWARRRETGAPEQTRWSIFYRVKGSLDPAAASDWSEVRELAKADAVHHEREPALLVAGGGDLEVFLASDRDGGWSIWRNTLSVSGVTDVSDLSSHAWDPGSAEPITGPPFSGRAPQPVADGDEVRLVYRSNRSLAYASQVYRAFESLDARYAGSTMAHVRNSEKLALRGELEDFQAYTYDTGGEEDDWYRRDTLGVYLTPDTLDPDKITRETSRLGHVLREFMPLTDRAVLITRPDLHTEAVYTYDLPGAQEASFIAESWADLFTSQLTEGALEPEEDFSDELET